MTDTTIPDPWGEPSEQPRPSSRPPRVASQHRSERAGVKAAAADCKAAADIEAYLQAIDDRVNQRRTAPPRAAITDCRWGRLARTSYGSPEWHFHLRNSSPFPIKVSGEVPAIGINGTVIDTIRAREITLQPGQVGRLAFTYFGEYRVAPSQGMPELEVRTLDHQPVHGTASWYVPPKPSPERVERENERNRRTLVAFLGIGLATLGLALAPHYSLLDPSPRVGTERYEQLKRDQAPITRAALERSRQKRAH